MKRANRLLTSRLGKQRPFSTDRRPNPNDTHVEPPPLRPQNPTGDKSEPEVTWRDIGDAMTSSPRARFWIDVATRFIGHAKKTLYEEFTGRKPPEK